jgi:hypothetical protein
MSMENLQVICVGNSHLASFSYALKKFPIGVKGISFKFWPVTYMASQWDDFNSNEFLTSPKFKADNPAGLPDSDKACKKKSILVLVGLGLSGNSIFNQFGELGYVNPSEVMNGYNHSPLMPVIHGHEINESAASAHISKRNAPHYSIGLCEKMFTNSISIFLNKLRSVAANSYFQNVYCVPAPNMPEKVAQWRFGEDYYNSGCQRVINDTYRDRLDRLITGLNITSKIDILQHDISLENELGFIYQRYAASNQLNDNHTNPMYYRSSICQLKDRINELNSRTGEPPA